MKPAPHPVEPAAEKAEKVLDVEGGLALVGWFVEGGTLSTLTGFTADAQESLYRVAYLFYQHARYTDALRAFAYLMTQNHLDRRFYMGFAASLQMLNEHEKAAKYYGVASLLDLTDPAPALHTAECLIATGDFAGARDSIAYGIALARDEPAHVQLLERLLGLEALMLPGETRAGAPNEPINLHPQETNS